MEKKMEYLYKKLRMLEQQSIYPFHMPGHKRNIKMAENFNPYAIDLTEIDGFDNLHNPKGIIKNSMERVQKIYKTTYSWFLINGSSSGILSAICACTKKGDYILVARNCHKSVYHAISLMELIPIYVYPKIDYSGISTSISPDDVTYMLNSQLGRKCKVVVLTSPTYEGIVSDVEKIAEIAHKRKIPLIVDEAHGAHFIFHNNFPESAINYNADIVIQSVHKTLPAFTQSALLHYNGNSLIKKEKIEQYLTIFQTSSPSYLLMGGIDWCMQLLEEKGNKLFDQFIKRLDQFYLHMNQLKKFSLYQMSHKKRDYSKILILTDHTNLTGKKLYDILLKRYHLALEMASPSYVLAITTIFDTEEGLGRLAQALLEIEEEIDFYKKERHEKEVLPTLEQVCQIHEALQKEGKQINWNESSGCISREYRYLYPPGIPILVPGERITQEVITQILQYKKIGLSVLGAEKEEDTIIIVREEIKDA